TGLARTTLANPALLGAAGAGFPDWQYDQAWSVRLAGRDPYRFQYAAGPDGYGYGQGWYAALKKNGGEALDARLSTDRQGVRQFNFVNASVPADQITVEEAFSLSPDSSYGDSEEQNLLFKGISNLITTRSDVFTVYFRIRTVKQDPTHHRRLERNRSGQRAGGRALRDVRGSQQREPAHRPAAHRVLLARERMSRATKQVSVHGRAG
ncbi:MAG: hypothetical protein EBR71_13125, partial [Planctomycetes bacterium]|nr:hypothetical protein [Planctomycetota bacterium]